MEEQNRIEQATGFVPWMERHVLWRFRSMGAFIAALAVELFAAFCIVGIGVEGGGVYRQLLEIMNRGGQLLACILTAHSCNVLRNSTASPKKQTVWFLLGAASFLIMVGTALALVVLYYGFGFGR